MHKVIGGLRQQAVNVCRCPSCSTPQASSTATRRAGTFAARSTKTQFLTSTTILCSGIATAAAYVDADSKNRRRQQWDKAIADLQKDVKPRKVREIDRGQVGWDQDTVVNPDQKWLDMLVDQIKMPGIVRLRGVPWNSAYNGSKLRYDQPPWSPKKTAATNLATEMMKMRFLQLIVDESPDITSVQQVLKDAADGLEPSEVSSWLSRPSHAIREYRNHLSEQLHMIWKAPADLELPSSHVDSTSRVLARRPPDNSVDQLNARLFSIFAKAIRGTQQGYNNLALVVDALDRSDVAPNLTTYNILLAGLMKLEVHCTVTAVIQNLLRCRLQPNETTMSLVLQHYIRRNYRQGFEKWLRLIRGYDGGFSLLTGEGQQQELDAPLPRWLKRRGGGPHKRVLLTTPTPIVFSAIIAGKLHFDGFKEAIFTCRIMGRQGWHLDINGLGPLLRHCAAQKDFEAGKEIWQTAIAMQQTASREHGKQTSIPLHLHVGLHDLYKNAAEVSDNDYKKAWSQDMFAKADEITKAIQKAKLKWQKLETSKVMRWKKFILSSTADDIANARLTVHKNQPAIAHDRAQSSSRSHASRLAGREQKPISLSSSSSIAPDSGSLLSLTSSTTDTSIAAAGERPSTLSSTLPVDPTSASEALLADVIEQRTSLQPARNLRGTKTDSISTSWEAEEAQAISHVPNLLRAAAASPEDTTHAQSLSTSQTKKRRQVVASSRKQSMKSSAAWPGVNALSAISESSSLHMHALGLS